MPTRTQSRISLASAVLASMAAVTLASCSLSIGGGLDTTAVEDQIAQGIQEQLGVAVTVDCPDGVDQEQGNDFTCTAVDDRGNEATVKVTQVDDEGNLEWDLDAAGLLGEEALLDDVALESQIAAWFEDQAGVPVVVDCPGGVDLERGNDFTCTATDQAGESVEVAVTQDDDLGNVSWEIVQ